MVRLLTICFAMLLNLSPLVTNQASAQTTGKPAGLSGATEAGGQGRREIVAMRTRTSRTYTEDGQYEADIYSGSINYQDAGGAWQPINNTLVSSNSAGYAHENRANSYSVRFPSDLGTKPLHMEMHGEWIELSLRGASGAGVASGDTETYAMPGYTLSYTAGNDLLKENIVLDGPQSPRTFLYDLKMSPRLTVQQSGNGIVTFIDETGAAVFAFATPYVYDSSGMNMSLSDAVSQTLGADSAGTTIAVNVDPTWLTQPGRRWPVTIDPITFFVYARWVAPFPPDLGCMLVSSTPNASYCAAVNMAVGQGGGTIHRSLLHFNVASVPRDAHLAQAQLLLHIYSGSPATTSNTINVYPVTRGGWTMGANWNAYDGVSSWSSPGGDFDHTAAASATIPYGTSSGTFEWDPTQLAQNWVDGAAANNGMILVSTDESATNLTSFWTSQPGVPTGMAPVFQLYYTLGTGQQSFNQTVGFPLDDRMNISVNVANGNLILHETDLSMPGIGLPLTIDRYYNSLAYDATYRGFGRGWSMGTALGISLGSANPNTSAYHTFWGPSNYGIEFARQPDGTFVSPPGIEATLVTNADSTYTMTFHGSQEKYTFDGSGQLVSDADRSGNAIISSYGSINGNPTLTAVRDTQGRVTAFSWAGSSTGTILTQMTDPGGRNYYYGYDSTYQYLTSYTDPSGATTYYTYNTYPSSVFNGLLSQVTDPDGKVTQITYQEDVYRRPRVSSITRLTPGGSPCAGTSCTYTFTYNSFGQTTVTDPNGHATVYDYDALLRTTSVVDPEGHTTSTTWNSDNQPTSVRDPNAHTTTYGYAADGTNDPTSAQLPTSALSTAQYQNASWPYQPSSSVDTQSHMTQYGYDGSGRTTTVTDPYGHVTRNTFNANGTLATVQDASGNQTSDAYYTTGTAVGLLGQVTYPAPRGATSYSYYATNLPYTVTDGNGQVTTYTYDGLGRTTSMTYRAADGTPAGSVAYTYDPDGNVTRVVDSTGTTTYSYDDLNDRIGKQLPSGQAIASTYDGAGNLLTVTDQGGTVTYVYTAANRLRSITDPASSTAISLSYDPAGNRTQISFPNHVTENMTYDASNQLTRIWATNFLSQTLTSYTYSYNNPNAGNGPTSLRWSVTDVANNVTKYDYDMLNRLTSAVTTNGATQVAGYSYGYDNVGNVTSETLNGATSALTYNAANELTTVTGNGAASYYHDGAGQLININPGLTSSYNAQMQTTVMSANGMTRTMTYTNQGQVERTSRGSDTFQYSLDDATIDEATVGTSTMYFTRTPDGMLLDERIPGMGYYYYLTDGLNSVVAVTNSTAQKANTYSYDPYGAPTSTGTVPNPFLYVSAVYDGNGFYKMGARFYQPFAAAFTQPDPAACASAQEPWKYSNDNPINASDPTGYGPGCGGFACPKPGHGADISCAVCEAILGAIFAGGTYSKDRALVTCVRACLKFGAAGDAGPFLFGGCWLFCFFVLVPGLQTWGVEHVCQHIADCKGPFIENLP